MKTTVLTLALLTAACGSSVQTASSDVSTQAIVDNANCSWISAGHSFRAYDSQFTRTADGAFATEDMNTVSQEWTVKGSWAYGQSTMDATFSLTVDGNGTPWINGKWDGGEYQAVCPDYASADEDHILKFSLDNDGVFTMTVERSGDGDPNNQFVTSFSSES